MPTPVGPVPRDPNDPDLWEEWDDADTADDDDERGPGFSWPIRIVALVIVVSFVLLVVLAA